MAHLEKTLDQLLKQSALPTPEMRVLKQLYFSSIYFREDRIVEVNHGTFNWLLDNEEPVIELDSAEYLDTGNSDASTELQQMIWEENLKQAHDKRLEARAALLSWLSRKSGIFHISGRAGCGKSTLMKLILNHERTEQELNTWGGSKQVVIAHFFFFRASTPDARSLEGLYRSILFKILIQQTDLIPEIFPDAYQAFERNPVANSIDGVFFRTSQLYSAMKRFLERSSHLRYRFCFLIDGLDEFGEAGSNPEDHQILAENLLAWTTSGNIKLLVSSRPYPEFMSAFSNYSQVKLHEVNKLDILNFGLERFESHKQFHRVRNLYKPLLKDLADQSNGIFLWAHLVISQLLHKLGLGEEISSLRKHLVNVPQDIKELYQSMLNFVDIGDRDKSLRIFWLAICFSTFRFGLPNSLLMFSWIDELFDDPHFPLSCQIRTHSVDEIEVSQKHAELQLGYYTKGLIDTFDAWPSTEPTNSPFQLKLFNFLHRTVFDFIRQNQDVMNYAAKYPNLTERLICLKASLARLYFHDDQYVHSGHLEHQPWNDMVSLNRDETRIWLNAYKSAITYHITRNSRGFEGWAASLQSRESRLEEIKMSWAHWIIYEFQDEKFILDDIKDINLVSQPDGLSYLFTAAYGRYVSLRARQMKPRVVKHLLEAGASPNDRMTATLNDSYICSSVWHFFCVAFARKNISSEYSSQENWGLQGLKYFLRTKEVEKNVVILLDLKKDGERYDDKFDENGATHAVSLLNLVQQLEPDNCHQWAREFGLLGKTPWAWLQNPSVSLSPRGKKSLTYVSTQHYLDYTLGMEIPESYRGNHAKNGVSFSVHSVVIGRTMLPATGLAVRVY